MQYGSSHETLLKHTETTKVWNLRPNNNSTPSVQQHKLQKTSHKVILPLSFPCTLSVIQATPMGCQHPLSYCNKKVLK